MPLIDPLLIARAKMVAPWLADNEQLFERFVDFWADPEYGTADLALRAVRTTPEYEQLFPGIKRDDGTLRMTEAEYLSYREFFTREVGRYVNPVYFEDLFPQLVEGEVSPAEFQERLDTIIDRVTLARDEVRQAYAEFAGIDLSDTEIIASLLRPELADPIFQRQITEAELAGAGRSFGFNLDVATVERLAEMGVTARSADELFTQARQAIPVVASLVQRHLDPNDEFTIEDFLSANVFADERERSRIRRAFEAETALFTPFAAFRESDQGILGAAERR